MIDVTIMMTVSADKRKEVLITIKDLLGRIRLKQGCVSCNCYLDVEAEEVVIFKQEWKDNEALATHLRSGHFKVLLGTIKLLLVEPEIRINTIVASEGMEAIAAAQGDKIQREASLYVKEVKTQSSQTKRRSLC